MHNLRYVDIVDIFWVITKLDYFRSHSYKFKFIFLWSKYRIEIFLGLLNSNYIFDNAGYSTDHETIAYRLPWASSMHSYYSELGQLHVVLFKINIKNEDAASHRANMLRKKSSFYYFPILFKVLFRN